MQMAESQGTQSVVYEFSHGPLGMGFVKSDDGFDIIAVAPRGQAELLKVKVGYTVIKANTEWLYSMTLEEAQALIVGLPRPLTLEIKGQTKAVPPHRAKSIVAELRSSAASLRDSASSKVRLSLSKSASLRDSASSKMRSSFRNLLPRNAEESSPDSVACNVAVLLEPPPACDWGRSSFENDDFLTISLDDDDNNSRNRNSSIFSDADQSQLWVDTDRFSRTGCPKTPPGRPQHSPSHASIESKAAAHRSSERDQPRVSSRSAASILLRSKVSSAIATGGRTIQQRANLLQAEANAKP